MTTPIAILTAGPRAWASSRLRGFWLADAAPDLFTVYEPGAALDNLDDHDLVVFQKRHGEADIERARRLKQAGKRVVYDMTDPVWFWQPEPVKVLLRLADVITCSSPGLGRAVSGLGHDNVAVIPDRMLSSYHPTAVTHGEREAVTLVWFGMASNRHALFGALPYIEYLSHTHALRLRVIDNAPEQKLAGMTPLRYEHVPWTLETFHANLLFSDIAVLPPFPGPWGQLKSSNREATAWWAGLPVTSGYDLGELTELVRSADRREAVGASNRARAEASWDIRQSVNEWRQLLDGSRLEAARKPQAV